MRAALLLRYTAFVVLFGLLGLSLTRTNPLRGANGFSFCLGGIILGLLLAACHWLLRERLAEALPPPERLRGMKVFLFGFLLAVIGWLVAAFTQVSYGAPVGVIGFLVGVAGLSLHARLAAADGDA